MHTTTMLLVVGKMFRIATANSFCYDTPKRVNAKQADVTGCTLKDSNDTPEVVTATKMELLCAIIRGMTAAC